ncbi:MAG: hypothetical protein C9356_08830 [Oleiphilus sp.]|nr:MAG: hypothetical protein C9356_08830 [Oleiphilus sp.]
MSGPSQPKVEGEQWSDERIKAFLDLEPLDGKDPDYHVLIEAYQYMVPEFFERFVAFFEASGRNINARSPDGETILARLKQHGRAAPYIRVLEQAGAKD